MAAYCASCSAFFVTASSLGQPSATRSAARHFAKRAPRLREKASMKSSGLVPISRHAATVLARRQAHPRRSHGFRHSRVIPHAAVVQRVEPTRDRLAGATLQWNQALAYVAHGGSRKGQWPPGEGRGLCWARGSHRASRYAPRNSPLTQLFAAFLHAGSPAGRKRHAEGFSPSSLLASVHTQTPLAQQRAPRPP